MQGISCLSQIKCHGFVIYQATGLTDLPAASLRYQRQVLVATLLFKWLGDDLFAAGVADMDIKAPPVVVDAMQKRLDHGVFGYEQEAGGYLSIAFRIKAPGIMRSRHLFIISPR